MISSFRFSNQFQQAVKSTLKECSSSTSLTCILHSSCEVGGSHGGNSEDNLLSGM
jgi:hypothetical protein